MAQDDIEGAAATADSAAVEQDEATVELTGSATPAEASEPAAAKLSFGQRRMVGKLDRGASNARGDARAARNAVADYEEQIAELQAAIVAENTAAATYDSTAEELSSRSQTVLSVAAEQAAALAKAQAEAEQAVADAQAASQARIEAKAEEVSTADEAVDAAWAAYRDSVSQRNQARVELGDVKANEQRTLKNTKSAQKAEAKTIAAQGRAAVKAAAKPAAAAPEAGVGL